MQSFSSEGNLDPVVQRVSFSFLRTTHIKVRLSDIHMSQCIRVQEGGFRNNACLPSGNRMVRLWSVSVRSCSKTAEDAVIGGSCEGAARGEGLKGAAPTTLRSPIAKLLVCWETRSSIDMVSWTSYSLLPGSVYEVLMWRSCACRIVSVHTRSEAD
jgi:hypothetical protein